MNVKFLVISYKFNFLADALLRTMPKGLGDVVVVHNGKTRDRVDRFDAMGAREVFHDGDDNHGVMLDEILVRQRYPAVTDGADWVVCLDHDLYLMQRRFEAAHRLFASSAHGTRADVVARRRPGDPAGPWVYHWWTVPFFWVRPSGFAGSGLTWTAEPRDGVIYDTGQALYDRNRSKFNLVDHQTHDVGMHFGSYWATASSANERFLEKLKGHYHLMIHLGYFRPSDDEWGDMRSYPAFDMAAKYRGR